MSLGWAIRRARAGMTLIEILVVMAVLALVTAVAVPTLQAVWDLEQRGAARDLATTYRFLLNEAAMRNVTFRIAFDLDANTWQVEVGDPHTLVFSTPEAREDFLKEQDKTIHAFEKEDAEAAAEPGTFAGLTMPGLESKQSLPSNSAWGFVYTPQYGAPMTPTLPGEERDEELGPNIVYSYIFANGEAEYAVVRIVSRDDPEDGYSVEVEPISGKVRLDSDLLDIGASLAWLPTEGPSFR